MNVAFTLAIIGYRISTFTIRVDIDAPAVSAAIPAVARPTVLDAVSDYFASRWASRRMAAVSA